jgi:hypothetical protein
VATRYLIAVVVIAAALEACSEDAAAPPDAGVEAGADAATADATSEPDAAAPCQPFVMPASCTADGGIPDSLECTGLYSDFDQRTLACDVREFAPAFQLWSDGASKRRFIYLPPGAKIDTSDIDEWTFPAGTKLWKEFALGGSLVETRLYWKAPDPIAPQGVWKWTTYVWSVDGKTAARTDSGVRNIRGTGYDVPSVGQCRECHIGRQDQVLGFDVISMSAPGAWGLPYSELVARGLLTSSPPAPTIPGNATEKAALGYLHANCGVPCHNATAANPANLSGLHLKLRVETLGSVQSTDAVKTGINKRPSNNWPGQPAAPDGGWYDIHPGDVERSLLPARMALRDLADGGRGQMPPLVTHAVDDAGVGAVKSWIQSMTVDGGYPAPAP